MKYHGKVSWQSRGGGALQKKSWFNKSFLSCFQSCFDKTKHWEQSASRANEVSSHLSAHLGSHLKHILKQIMPTLRCKHVFLWLFHFRLKKKKSFPCCLLLVIWVILGLSAILLISQSWERAGCIHVYTHSQRDRERDACTKQSHQSDPIMDMGIKRQYWALLGKMGKLHYMVLFFRCMCGFTHWLTDFSVFIVQTMNRKQKSKNKFKMSIFDQNLFWTYFKQRCIVW